MTDWQQAINSSFKDSEALLDYLQIPIQARANFIPLKDFPLRVTPFYADLIKKNTPNDPLLLQVIPQTLELLQHPDYTNDAVGDQDAIKHPGLIHKYKGRVLLSMTGACAIHCRYCFRRNFAYADNMPDLSPTSDIINYLKADNTITEVIFSGGDPLMLSDKKLEKHLTALDAIQQIKTIRFHTRMPSILPSRINASLIQLLASSSKHIIFVSHINHAQEINAEVQAAFNRLRQANITLLNQAVLLKGINDTVSDLKALSLKVFESGIMPYYLHCLDKVTGTTHFDLPTKKARQLVDELTAELPGYLIPRLVQEIPQKKSKTHV
ncbi:MAG: EF-P beta-lysylation protein EpmB [Gammaproteobacteria bacterium]|nr:EF-P beta-lysylation protein EpmB [Gammaproteobacteria bacterium]